jgi:hypothetical protein
MLKHNCTLNIEYTKIILLSFESSQRDKSNEYKIMKFQSLDTKISLNIHILLVDICML